MKIKVLLVDDHAMVRDGLRYMLESQQDFNVVGDAATGLEAVKAARDLTPDVIVMDIAMPDLNGIEATELICEDNPGIKIIILSMYATSDHIYRALQSGARGYLLKESAGAELFQAIRTVAQGQRYLSKKITETIVDDYIVKRKENPGSSPLDRLSTRERQIMQLVVEGHTSSEIAKILHISAKTVDTYRSRLMQKLNLTDIPALVKFAVQLGITRIN